MLRNRKNKRYNEEVHDEDDGRGRQYNIKSKIRSERFEHLRDLQELSGHQVTLSLIQRNGFDKPILVTSPDGLDLSVPSKGFVVRDVGKLVGYDRMIDVMDVRTQKNIEMTMKDWCKYYESRNRDRLLNVISLEFSHTDLASQIDSPKIVKLLDWVDLVWPKFLKESQTESTNSIDRMKYPKVQKYCLMSVKGSYTDFHIDFGGTSVWYHILRGKKIFWMAPPTELNLQAFEEWTLSGMQQDVFFGDTVEECFRVELTAGNTFFIPSGWIHAVYTLEDSLVFGGNFLHSFGIENQLKVSRIEDATKVPVKFRYPFYTEILWYVVQHYVYCLTGKSHLQNSAKNSATTTPEKNSKANTESKPIKKKLKIVEDDSATESEHEVSDKSKKTVTPSPPKKKRGRPPKRPQEDPTDDESTEIDSEYEDVKPTKSTTTCRMTKNSLLRLQYELEEPQPQSERHSSMPNRSSTKQTKSPKNGSPSKESETKSVPNKSPKTATQTFKPEQRTDNESTSKIKEDDSVKPDKSIATTPSDPSRLNGWSDSSKAIWSNPDSEPKEPSKIHITKTEINGLKLLVKYLSKLSGAKKNMPNLIRNSRSLLDDCKKLIAEHENDDQELAVTGVPVTPDLLNPKKSDINQLIEQFFKPIDSTLNDDVSNESSAVPLKSRSDSSTLTMQHRLKYNQILNLNKLEDRKNVILVNDSGLSKSSSHKDAKSTTSTKKPSSSSPTISSASSSLANVSSNDLPRPKSPPTRPLSNKQYSSRTKNDKNDSALVLPGSFADLIAATSTAKEVFDVSADVTSSLFGTKSPNKLTPTPKEKQNSSANDSKKISKTPFDIDSITSTTALDETKNQTNTKKEESTRPSSPQPPKITPPKRFITAANNRPQIKEKLIFASAPYVSPVHASDYQRHQHPWQNPPNQQVPQQKPNDHQQWTPQQHHSHFSANAQSKTNETPKLTTTSTPLNTSIITPKQPVSTIQIKSSESCQPDTNPNQEKICPTQSSFGHKSAQFVVIKKADAEQALSPLIVGSSEKDHPQKTDGTSVRAKCTQETSIHQEMQPTTKLHVEQHDKPEEDPKIKKPRGPLKKSKEARQAIEIMNSPNQQAAPISVIKLNTGPQLPVVVQSVSSVPTNSAQPASTSKEIAGSATDSKVKIKPKTKKSKKQSDESSTSGACTDKNPPIGLTHTTLTRPPVIHGLVSTPASQANPPTQLPKAGQQYLISRPVLFNTMPAFSSAHLPHMNSTSMPVFTTPIPTSMGLHNMQPGARILWATRPRAQPIVTSAPVVPRPAAVPTQPNKKQAAKPLASSDLLTRQPDNAALLSLATTALSTAPLPTTPTLSNMGSRIPNPAQAYVVNPNLFAAQQYYNPYMQQLPMVQYTPRDTNSAALLAGAQFRTMPPRPSGQLLFAPLLNQTGQPRYLITQPGFMPHRHQSPLYPGHQPATSLSFAAFQPSVVSNSSKEPTKAKKVKTR